MFPASGRTEYPNPGLDPRGEPDTTVTSPCTSAAAMAYPEKSSQRSSVSSVSSHVRLSQSSSKSYSLLRAREEHVSTQQENPSRQGATLVPKALPLLTGRAAALEGLARVSSSMPKPNS